MLTEKVKAKKGMGMQGDEEDDVEEVDLTSEEEDLTDMDHVDWRDMMIPRLMYP